MTLECFKVDRSQDGLIAYVVLNRPTKKNSMNKVFFSELGHIFRNIIDPDPKIRVVILCGEGNGFSSGLDLKDLPLNQSKITEEKTAVGSDKNFSFSIKTSIKRHWRGR